jgi:hypothetical protein
MKLQAPLLTLVLIAVSAAGVSACQKVATTTVARSVEEGDRIEKSWVRTWSDRARFECVASSSGACAVVVFVSECPGAACKTRILKDFILPAGESANLHKLPAGFKYCLSHTSKPVAPACTNV